MIRPAYTTEYKPMKMDPKIFPPMLPGDTHILTKPAGGNSKVNQRAEPGFDSAIELNAS